MLDTTPKELENNSPQGVITSALESIPFEELIGGPLSACVKAQEMAAEATWKYIREVGFISPDNTDEHEAIIISFLFQQDNIIKKLSMPLLTVVPVPYISIDSVDISFRADMSASSDGELLAKYSTLKDTKIESKYNIQNVADINIRATSTYMPAGIAKMLDLFSNTCIQLRDYEDKKLEDEEFEDKTTEAGEKKTDDSTSEKAKEKSVEKDSAQVYSVFLSEKLTEKNKAAVVGIIMKTVKDLTEKEILSRSKTTNMTITGGMSLEEAKTLVDEINQAGGNAQYKKM